jgi:hypothetical protein
MIKPVKKSGLVDQMPLELPVEEPQSDIDVIRIYN